MAQSPAHKWGQIIGDFIESSIEQRLEEFADQYNLYLDKRGERKARSGKKVTWTDNFGNTHDLDYVLEKDGTDEHIGEPVAFIEIAWRRYTKHSRNKAQEIQGAVLPLYNKFAQSSPFIGAILAGAFTQTAVRQLESLGFNVLYFPYDLIVKGFKDFYFDVGSEESMPEKDFRQKIEQWNKFQQKGKLASHLFQLNQKEVDDFFMQLEGSLTRAIKLISITPLHGKKFELKKIEEAIDFLDQYHKGDHQLRLKKFELVIHYTNGDVISATFNSKNQAKRFLNTQLP